MSKEDLPELYHFTSFEGLLGIIENNNLWCTHNKFLNDKEEFENVIDHHVDNTKLENNTAE